jgi:hypothetical protein
LALQRKYGEARSAKSVADEVQRQEEAVAQSDLEVRMKNDYQKLRERHRIDFEKLDSFYGTILTDLRVKMRKELDIIQNALKASETKQNTAMSKRQFVHYRKVSTEQVYQTCSTIPTPRTAEKFTRYRTGPPGALNLSPMDDRKIAKLPSSPVRPKRRPSTPIGSSFPKLA